MFPEDWITEKLEDLSEDGIINGTFFDPKKTGSGFRHINIDQMYIGPRISTNGLKLLSVNEATFKKKQAKYGDIFFTRSSLVWEGIAYCNVLLDQSPDFTFDDHLMRVRPKKDIIVPQYLNEYCRTSIARKFFQTRAKRSSMTTIGQSDIGDLLVGFPSIKEQEKIVKILSAWDEAIEILNRSIQIKIKAKNVFVSSLLSGKKRFVEFGSPLADGTSTPDGWLETTLGEIGTWRGGGTPSKSNKKFWENGNVPWISPKDMKSERLTKAEDYITEEAIKSSATNYLKKGSILLVTRSGILKHSLPCAIADVDLAINQDIKAVTVSGGISNEYVFYYLRRHERTLLEQCAKVGTTVESIDFDALKKFKIVLPKIDEQEKIAKCLSSWSREIEALSNFKFNLSKQKHGLMKQLLTGKKRVKI